MAWMWGALLAATMAAWLHQLTAITAGEDILAGHGVRGGKAMIATLRWRLIAVPGRLIRHARHLVLRLPPGHSLLPEVLARLRDLPAPSDLRLLSPGSPSLSTAVSPDRRKALQTTNPAPTSGPSACPPPGILAHQDHLWEPGSTHRVIREIGSEADQGNFGMGNFGIERQGAVRLTLADMPELPVKLDHLGPASVLNVVRDIWS